MSHIYKRLARTEQVGKDIHVSRWTPRTLFHQSTSSGIAEVSAGNTGSGAAGGSIKLVSCDPYRISGVNRSVEGIDILLRSSATSGGKMNGG
jgi:hypothetical protein